MLLRERKRLARALLECASRDDELRRVVEEAGLSKERVKENLAAVLELALARPESGEFLEKVRRAGLAHAANLVHADSLICCFFALLSEALLVLEEAGFQSKEDAVRGLCKALGLALALMVASYEDSVVRALGGNPDLLRTVLKVYAKELLRGG